MHEAFENTKKESKGHGAAREGTLLPRLCVEHDMAITMSRAYCGRGKCDQREHHS